MGNGGGSSPRTRGTQLRRSPGRARRRFIPAHAGNTICKKFLCAVRAVHPRARGEHSRSDPTNRRSHGSSPRTRGTRKAPPAKRRAKRFIPAHAGNTPPRSTARCGPPVHPRARGEHSINLSSVGRYLGSSPRTRGTLVWFQPLAFARRFIPAHAGNTAIAAFARLILSVHPRARGEHGAWRRACAVGIGSSPRTRGTRKSAPIQSRPTRFIPAHAGNTRV